MAFTYYLSDILTRHFFLGEDLTPPLASPNAPYLALTTGISVPDVWIEVSGGDYARQPITLSWSETDDENILYNDYTLYFPRASANWGNVIGIILYDGSGSSSGSPLFDCPWYDDDTWTKVPSYTINSGQRLFLSPWHFVSRIFGQQPYSVENGGMSVEYTKIVMQWIADMASVPYARTYDLALGRNAEFDSLGRFAGIWSECSGTGYSRMPLGPSDWGSYDMGKTVKNENEIVFTNNAPSSWGTLSDFVLYVHDTNIAAFWGHISPHLTVNTGQACLVGGAYISIDWGGDNIV
jgi:hypothetical protein